MRRFGWLVMVALVLVGTAIGCSGGEVSKAEFAALQEKVEGLKHDISGLNSGQGYINRRVINDEAAVAVMQEFSRKYEESQKQYEQDRKVLFKRTSTILDLKWALEFPGEYGEPAVFVDMSNAIFNRIYMAQQLQQNGDRSGARSVMLSVFPYLASYCGSAYPVRAYLLPEELRWTLQGSGFHLASEQDLQEAIDRQNALDKLAWKEFHVDKEVADYVSIVKDKLPGCR